MPLWAQEPADWRTPLQEGQQAVAEGRYEEAVSPLTAAAAAIPASHLTRPWIQYHLARALAGSGEPEEAVGWLQVMWEEDIEGLMLDYTRVDPVFDEARALPAYAALMEEIGAMELTRQPLGDNLTALGGAGSNVIVLIRDGSALVVDTGYGLAVPALQRAVEALGGGSIGAVVLTHPHEDHVGAAGTLTSVGEWVAHPATSAVMAEGIAFTEGVAAPPRGPEALPDRLVEESGALPGWGGDVILIPMPAHTEGDLMVHFPRHEVLHMGDLYLAGNTLFYPGSVDPVSYLTEMEAFLSGLPATTEVVSGHDPAVPVSAVLDQVVETRDIVEAVAELVAEDASIEAIQARAEAEGWPLPWVGFFVQVLQAQAEAEAEPEAEAEAGSGS